MKIILQKIPETVAYAVRPPPQGELYDYALSLGITVISDFLPAGLEFVIARGCQFGRVFFSKQDDDDYPTDMEKIQYLDNILYNLRKGEPLPQGVEVKMMGC